MIAVDLPNWIREPRTWQECAYNICRNHLVGSNPKSALISAIMGAGKEMLISELSASVRLNSNQVVVISTSTVGLVESIQSASDVRCGQARSVGFWYGQKKRLGQVIVTCVPSVESLAHKLKSCGLETALWMPDEAHRSECESIIRAHKTLNPQTTLGFTATAFRSDSVQTLSLFDKCIYRYGMQQALDDGVIVPWRIVNHKGGLDDVDRICVEMIKTAEGPGLINALTIQDANYFALMLARHGIGALPVHSKLKSKEKNEALKAVEDGTYKCIVHVNLLSEGANYPWLRWMCLRRPVRARVRFIQEIGRLLRSHPGKFEAVFYDPHDLFGFFKLSYSEALGEAPEKPDPKELDIDPMIVLEKINEQEPAVAMAWIESLIRSMVVACDAEGMMTDRKTLTKAARLKPSTALQRTFIKRRNWGMPDCIPKDWQECFEAMADKPEYLRYGFAGDFIASLVAIKKHQRWPFRRKIKLLFDEDGQGFTDFREEI